MSAHPEDPKTGIDDFTVKCPKCKRKVVVNAKQAEATMTVTCSCGETIELAKGFG